MKARRTDTTLLSDRLPCRRVCRPSLVIGPSFAASSMRHLQKSEADPARSYTKKTTVAVMFMIEYCIGNIAGPETSQTRTRPDIVLRRGALSSYLLCLLLTSSSFTGGADDRIPGGSSPRSIGVQKVREYRMAGFQKTGRVRAR